MYIEIFHHKFYTINFLKIYRIDAYNFISFNISQQMLVILYTLLFTISCQSEFSIKDSSVQYEIPSNDPTTIIFKGKGILTVGVAKAAQNKKKIIIEEGITEVEDDAFYRRIWPETENEYFIYEEVELPRSLTKIGARAFSISGRELKRVHFPDFKTDIPEKDIPETELESFYSLREIGADAFARQPLTSHNIPGTFTELGTRAFEMSQLSHIRLNSKLSVIRSYTFMSCEQLTEIVLPISLTNISNNAFMNCKNLRKVTWNAPEVNLFGYDAFYGCESLEDFIFPPIGSGFEQSGEYFGNCYSLKRCIFPYTITGNMLGPKVFLNCRSLEEATLPSNLNTIFSQFFMNSGIDAAFLPESVTSIGSSAFKDCSNLKWVHFASKETITIEADSFSGATNVQTMVFDGNMTDFGPNILVGRVVCYNGIINPQSSDGSIDTEKTKIYLTEEFRQKNPNQKFGLSPSSFDGFPYDLQRGDICALPTPRPTPLPSVQPTSTPKQKKGLSTLEIVLIIVCILAVGAIVSVIVVILVIRKKKNSQVKIQDSAVEAI